MGYKAYLVDSITSDLEVFKCRSDKEYAVSAAVAYGIYKGIGGQRVIPLPLFTDNIIKIVTACTTVLTKGSKQTHIKIFKKLEELLDNNINIKEDGPDYIDIELSNGDNIHRIHSQNITNAIADIAIYLINLDKNYNDINNIESLIYTYFDKIRRA